MGHYIISFTVYTLAMCGLIFFALFIYKKVMGGNMGTNKTKQLSIEESMSINPRKTIMIIKAGEERFLIASDIDKTTLLAKLENNNIKNGGQILKDAVSKSASNEKIMHAPDLEQVKNNIEMNNLDLLYPQKEKYMSVKTSDTKEKAPKSDNTVHLEVITNKNPQIAGLNRHHSANNRTGRNVEITVDETKNHGLSTIKELVHKVNEM